MKINFIEISKISSENGSLSFLESNNQIPFEIKRVYYIYDLKKEGLNRGEHAHFNTKQVLFCINGSVDIHFDNGKDKTIIKMNKANKGLFIPKMMWHSMSNFSKNCIILVIASDIYNEDDYIRKYETFINNI